jgi:membrane fusion protein (multidrug efflux system)
MATTDMAQTEPSNLEKKSNKFRNLIVFVVIAACLAAAGYFYIRHQKLYPSTDDAYIHANILYVAPQISGKVLSVNV